MTASVKVDGIEFPLCEGYHPNNLANMRAAIDYAQGSIVELPAGYFDCRFIRSPFVGYFVDEATAMRHPAYGERFAKPGDL